MKGLKRKFASWILCGLLVAGLTGCSGETEKVKDLPAADVASAVLKAGEYTEDLIEIPMDLMSNLKMYTLDTELVEDMALYASGSGGFTDEVAVFKMKDQDGVKAAQEAVDARIASQKTAFEDYQPQEMPKLENAKVLTKGNYVCFIAGDKAEEAATAFNDTLKG